MKKSFRFQRETFSSQINKTIKSLIVTLSIMIVVLATFFMSMISDSGQKGYELKELQIQNKELQSTMEKLKKDVTKTVSFQKIEESSKIKEMQKPGQKIYVKDKTKP
ncbi:MAG: hypothetical protein AAB551_01540 [Patescibacteria group bacterium]